MEKKNLNEKRVSKKEREDKKESCGERSGLRLFSFCLRGATHQVHPNFLEMVHCVLLSYII